MTSKQSLLLQRLTQETGCSIDLMMNRNEKTMISILDRTPHYAKISLHEIFLEAPQHVVEAMGRYILTRRKTKRAVCDRIVLRDFIHDALHHADYSEQKPQEMLRAKGTCYDLIAIYQEVNQLYFEKQLDLNITWFGKKKPHRAPMTLGEYVRHLKLIKVHCILDQRRFPSYLVQYIVFHEMLHATYPPKKGESGKLRIHTPEFLAAERKYPDFIKVQQWKQKHQEYFFR